MVTYAPTPATWLAHTFKVLYARILNSKAMAKWALSRTHSVCDCITNSCAVITRNWPGRRFSIIVSTPLRPAVVLGLLVIASVQNKQEQGSIQYK